MVKHYYNILTTWTGNTGQGTETYTAYERAFEAWVKGKPKIKGSSDPNFRGDSARYNPEELLVASLSSCHMLWYLHLCSVSGVIVLSYTDKAEGLMEETENGGGRFSRVDLHPVVGLPDAAMIDKAIELHTQAHEMCFIANSCNFPVYHNPVCTVAT
ncbi:OsmC family peroxiredoxin [Flavobacterium zepuense]|uniref:OsmC family peroxiredoxin n=1 Tax=Flavobacterium zepuense TaxID=2593302 RepID=A0A552UX76_9FLAO|nr:OsmC family protein [Flavobacterium zepuense]TRW22826.1 OsmC family peroxiredoxin [Flavobacterium zepuense]